MKKLKLILAIITFIAAVALSSCRTSKPPCPAYSSTQTVEVEHTQQAR